MQFLNLRSWMWILLNFHEKLTQVYYYGSTFISSGAEGNILHLRKLNQPFSWQEEEVVDGRNASQEAVATCRNSVQGRETIADDRGYVCDRSDLLASGCCDANSSTVGRFLCTSCDQVQLVFFYMRALQNPPKGGSLLFLL